MRRLAGLIAAALVVGGCGGEDGAPPPRLDDPETLPIAECVALHVNALARTVERFQQFIDYNNGAPLPVGIMVTSSTEYTMLLDLEPDGLDDITLDFEIVSGANVSDGWTPGEMIQVELTFTGAVDGGSTTTAISFVDAAPDFISVRGNISLDDGGTCSFASPNYVVSWDEGDLDTATPNFVFTAAEGGQTFEGQIFLDFEDDDFLAVSGTFDGMPAGFLIELESFDVFED